MSELRYAQGTRVRWQKEGGAARLGVLVEDCQKWHSFATVQLDRESEPLSVWVGDVTPVSETRT